jgi:hypothetical protein
MRTLHHSKKLINPMLIAAGVAAAIAAPAFAGIDSISRTAGPTAGPKTDAESVAHVQWRDALKQNPERTEGCFRATYPNIVWERVQCRTDEPRYHPVHAPRGSDDPEVTGNGNDYVAYAKGLITAAGGDAEIWGVTSEQSVGAGIVGPNEYSLQLNTNDRMSTSACAGHSGCTVWQQFVYATDYFISPAHTAGLFMQYWLVNYGRCPTGWHQDGNDCYKNSAVVEVPDYPIAGQPGEILAGLSANVTPGGTDSVTFTFTTPSVEEAYSVSGKDSVLDIAEIWNKVEFNVLGDAGGSEAVFNSGTSIAVNISLYDGTDAAPTCLANAGTTTETNNLSLGTCSAWSDPNSYYPGNIQFMETK